MKSFIREREVSKFLFVLLTVFFVGTPLCAKEKEQKLSEDQTAKLLADLKLTEHTQKPGDEVHSYFIHVVKNNKTGKAVATILNEASVHPDVHESNEEHAATLGFFSEMAVDLTGELIKGAGKAVVKGTKNVVKHHKADLAKGLAKTGFGALEMIGNSQMYGGKGSALINHYVKPDSKLGMLAKLAASFGSKHTK